VVLIALASGAGVLFTYIKKPWSGVKKAIRQAVEESIDEKMGYLAVEYNHRMRYDIINFEQDLRNGEYKSTTQFDYIMRNCDEYLRSGDNGKVKAAAEYIMDMYKNRGEK